MLFLHTVRAALLLGRADIYKPVPGGLKDFLFNLEILAACGLPLISFLQPPLCPVLTWTLTSVDFTRVSCPLGTYITLWNCLSLKYSGLWLPIWPPVASSSLIWVKALCLWEPICVTVSRLVCSIGKLAFCHNIISVFAAPAQADLHTCESCRRPRGERHANVRLAWHPSVPTSRALLSEWQGGPAAWTQVAL